MKFKIPFTSKTVEIRDSTDGALGYLLELFTNRAKSKAGVNVTSKEAIKIAAVMACVDIISSTVASLGCNLFKQQERGKSLASNHNIYQLLKQLPNKETTAFDFWVMYIVNLLLTGDAFAVIKRDFNGKISELWNVPSKNVTVLRNTNTNELAYKIKDEYSNLEAVYYSESILHTRGIRFNSKDASIDPIANARDLLGLSIALEEYGSKYFANGAQVGGIVEYPNNLTDPAFARFKDEFYKNYQGVVNSNKIMFLEDGAKFTKITNNPAESQALEARIFQVVEICRIFKVPPHKIFELSKSTNNNIEHQGIEFVQYCLGPMCVRLEQSISKDLLNSTERNKYFAKFNTNALLRGDLMARKDFYSTMIQNGVFSPNDVLELEDMNTFDGGDVHLVNSTMVPIERLGEVVDSRVKGGDKNGKDGAKDPAGNTDGNTEG